MTTETEQARWQYLQHCDNGFTLLEPDGSLLMVVGALYNSVAASRLEERVRRIVVSVNEFRDLTLDQIEDGVFSKMRDDRDYLLRDRDTVLKQNTALLASLKLVTMELGQIHAHHYPDCPGGCPSCLYMEAAQALIEQAGVPTL